MGTRKNPGKYDCAASALPDEHTFTLLARDPSFAPLVREWARMRRLAIKMGLAPKSDLPKCREAERLAAAGEAWRPANWPRRKPRPRRVVLRMPARKRAA